ncbi:MAG: Hpt domain-containing protein [Oleiphilus sp.]
MSSVNQSETVLNLAKLNEAFMNDLSIIKQILTAYQETVIDFEQRFKTLEREGNKENLSRLVHGLKGSSANIRAEQVATQAAKLQLMIDQGENYSNEVDPLMMSLNTLEQEINKLKS